MKKIIQSRIFLIIIISGIIFTCIGVHATYLYEAGDIKYGDSNVNDALNQLYSQSNEKVPYISNVYVYAYTNRNWNFGRYSSEITIKPNGCKSFTIDTINQGNPPSYTLTNAVETDTNKFEPIDSTQDVIITYEMVDGNNYVFGGNYRIISYE